jgi:hypothetical protein
MSFSINDFTDYVMAHEYGRPIPLSAQQHAAAAIHGTRFGFDRFDRFDRGRGWNQQHHTGHGFFPAGLQEGHFIPPGYCLAPWECDPDANVGGEPLVHPSSLHHLHHLHNPPFAPSSIGQDPLLDTITGQMIDLSPVPARPAGPQRSGSMHGSLLRM